jgi:hypothetical protein
VQRHVAVVAEFADGHPQPVVVTDADDGVGSEFADFAGTHPGAGEDLHDQAVTRIR